MTVDDWEEEVSFEDLIEYVGPNDIQVFRELSRHARQADRGTSVAVDWTQALCSGYSEDLWFCPGDTKPSAKAAKICFACPIRLECLQFACVQGERYGTWGGIPENVRINKSAKNAGGSHNFSLLSVLDNMYETEDKFSGYYKDRLRDWEPGQEYEDDNFSIWQREAKTNGG